MSLSDQERRTNIYWAINRAMGNSAELAALKSFARLQELCDQLWFSFLGRHSNGAHWFFGSSAVNRIEEPNSPWAVALIDHFEKDRAKKDTHQEDPNQTNPDNDDDDKDHFISITNMLRKAEPNALAAVYMIYAETENIIYALRRYRDDFLANYPALDKLVADIQGQCFTIFTQYDEFAKAYLMNQIMVNFIYARNSPIRRIAVYQCWHHNISRPMQHATLRQVREWHLALTKDPNPTNMITITLEMMGPSYHHEQELKDLIRIANQQEIPLDETRIRKAFDTHCAKENAAEGNSDRNHLIAIHGHDPQRNPPWQPAANPTGSVKPSP